MHGQSWYHHGDICGGFCLLISEGTVKYDLTAVLIHRGPSAYSGHYVAHIKDPKTKAWYKFNDEEIEKMEGRKLKLGTEDELPGE